MWGKYNITDEKSQDESSSRIHRAQKTFPLLANRREIIFEKKNAIKISTRRIYANIRNKKKVSERSVVFIVRRLNEDGITNHYFFHEIYIGCEFMRTNVALSDGLEECGRFSTCVEAQIKFLHFLLQTTIGASHNCCVPIDRESAIIIIAINVVYRIKAPWRWKPSEWSI